MPKPSLPKRFTIRVYGILLDERGKVLLSHEKIRDFAFTKFPGGGMELGEGPLDAVKREFFEETNLEVQVVRHIYTSDFYIQSQIVPEEQVIGIYYELAPMSDEALKIIPEKYFIQPFRDTDNEMRLSWVPFQEMNAGKLTFDMDKRAWEAFEKLYKENGL